MKKFIFIFLFFIYQNVFCQEYHFDNFYQYNSTNSTIFFLVNSVDSNYVFIGRIGYGDVLSGYINDIKNNEFHNYNVSNKNNSLTFEYINSKKNNLTSNFIIDDKIQYEYLNTKTDSTKTEIKVIRYKIGKKKKIIAKAEFEFDNKEYVFHNSLLRFFSHHFFDNRDLKSFDNKLPISMVFDYYNGNTFIAKLAKTNKINTLLSISKEQLNYNK